MSFFCLCVFFFFVSFVSCNPQWLSKRMHFCFVTMTLVIFHQWKIAISWYLWLVSCMNLFYFVLVFEIWNVILACHFEFAWYFDNVPWALFEFRSMYERTLHRRMNLHGLWSVISRPARSMLLCIGLVFGSLAIHIWSHLAVEFA